MNLPQFQQAIRLAMAEYQEACDAAKDRLAKAFAVAQQELFEDVREAPAEGDYVLKR